MRALIAVLLLSACASVVSDVPPAERLRGCWSNREGGLSTMRWFADGAREGVWTGSRAVFGPSGGPARTRYTLAPADAGHSFCEVGAEGAAPRCWEVAEGRGGSLEGGRVFIDRHGDRLRITVVGDGPERTIFVGRREGCR